MVGKLGELQDPAYRPTRPPHASAQRHQVMQWSWTAGALSLLLPVSRHFSTSDGPTTAQEPILLPGVHGIPSARSHHTVPLLGSEVPLQDGGYTRCCRGGLQVVDPCRGRFATSLTYSGRGKLTTGSPAARRWHGCGDTWRTWRRRCAALR